jgi:hypothetical protein
VGGVIGPVFAIAMPHFTIGLFLLTSCHTFPLCGIDTWEIRLVAGTVPAWRVKL